MAYLGRTDLNVPWKDGLTLDRERREVVLGACLLSKGGASEVRAKGGYGANW